MRSFIWNVATWLYFFDKLPILPPSNLTVYNGIFCKKIGKCLINDSGAFIISLEGLNMVKLKFGLNKFSNMFGLHYWRGEKGENQKEKREWEIIELANSNSFVSFSFVLEIQSSKRFNIAVSLFSLKENTRRTSM